MTDALTLSRDQISKLNEIVTHFKEVKQFKVYTEQLTGMGPVVRVCFDLFEPHDTVVEIKNHKQP
ncbi:hypothetical protein UFOVP116_162 [uncultured Caudovirales phage]|uniref:Uncharacterized protein n=1 Tax=uncultured Caudovirales phage TaxID=2100421 RepID=A0A6J5L705_9CAUD|nr:hypothetical protein UFOVP116_162 [uncultured Caudovirales phage]